MIELLLQYKTILQKSQETNLGTFFVSKSFTT